MMASPLMSEIYRMKDELAGRFKTIYDLAEAARRLGMSDPLPPPGRSRKMIEGFPRGQSVCDDDETMREMHQIKEKLSLEDLKKHQRFDVLSKRLSAKRKPKGRFRSPKSAAKHPRPE